MADREVRDGVSVVKAVNIVNAESGSGKPLLPCPWSSAPGTCVKRAWCGFTLIELIVVMAIIATLLTLAVPRYFHSTDRAKEAVLKQNLAQMRDSIDKYYGDRGRYPDSLEDLVSKKYLRKVPPDPITDSTTTWLTVPPDEPGKGGVFDVRSGAVGTGLDGSAYDKW
jgi:general secretion pathway protein G